MTEAVFENESYLPDKYDDEHCELTKKESEYIREMLERLNLPSANFPHIAEKILQKKNRGESVSEATMTHCFYLSLADMNIPFSVNDISSITGIKHSRISKDKNCKDSNIVIIKSEDILERACSKLNLNFKQHTLIRVRQRYLKEHKLDLIFCHYKLFSYGSLEDVCHQNFEKGVCA